MTKIIKQKSLTFKEQLKHQSWCFKNGYKIYFKHTTWNEGYIIIEKDNKKYESEEIYKQRKLRVKDIRYHEIVFNLYTKIYNNPNIDSWEKEEKENKNQSKVKNTQFFLILKNNR